MNTGQPTVTSISPNSGVFSDTTTLNTLTIVGTNLAYPGCTVSVGGGVCSTFGSSMDSTILYCSAPINNGATTPVTLVGVQPVIVTCGATTTPASAGLSSTSYNIVYGKIMVFIL